MREAVSFYYFRSLFIISLPLCLPLPVNTFVMCEHAAQNTTEFSLRLNLLEFPGRLTGNGSQLVENSPHLMKIRIHCIFTCIFRFEVVSLLRFFFFCLWNLVCSLFRYFCVHCPAFAPPSVSVAGRLLRALSCVLSAVVFSHGRASACACVCLWW